jgi:hypothetical protein
MRFVAQKCPIFVLTYELFKLQQALQTFPNFWIKFYIVFHFLCHLILHLYNKNWRCYPTLTQLHFALVLSGVKNCGSDVAGARAME